MLGRIAVATIAVTVLSWLLGYVVTGELSQVFVCEIWFLYSPWVAVWLMKGLGGVRASDGVLDSNELRIEGGKYDGLRTRWQGIDTKGTRLRGRVLSLDLGSGVQIPIARARTPVERSSLKALVETIRRRGRATRRKQKPRDEAPPEVLRCPHCGGAVAPRDQKWVKCPWCETKVRVGKLLRERIEAAADLGEDLQQREQLLQRLLRQPSAKRVNLVLVLTAVVGVALVPFTAFLHAITPTLWLLAITLVIGTVAQVLIVRRHALVLVTLDFAARSDTGNLSCRMCGGPLAEPKDLSVLVRCPYCHTENILGLDLVATHRKVHKEAPSLERVLAQTTRRVGRTELLAALIALGLLLLGWWSLSG